MTSLKVSEVELLYRSKVKAADRPVVRVSDDAYNILLNSWDMNKLELQEQFKVLLLDRKNSCLGVSTIATGTMNDCLIDLKLVFAAAILGKATSIIVAHNHPSGNLSPSEADKRVTEHITNAGDLLNVPVVDHLIITKDGYTSFSDKGLITCHNPKRLHF